VNPESPSNWKITRFFIPLAIQAVSQALSYPLVRLTALFMIFFPLSVAIRAQSEGLAAWLKKPTTVLAGHAVFMAAIIVTGFSLLNLGLPAQLIGPLGLTIGSLASSATMRLALNRAKERGFPVGPTTTSVGQIR
jgi:hypothetical protein